MRGTRAMFTPESRINFTTEPSRWHLHLNRIFHPHPPSSVLFLYRGRTGAVPYLHNTDWPSSITSLKYVLTLIFTGRAEGAEKLRFSL